MAWLIYEMSSFQFRHVRDYVYRGVCKLDMLLGSVFTVLAFDIHAYLHLNARISMLTSTYTHAGRLNRNLPGTQKNYPNPRAITDILPTPRPQTREAIPDRTGN